MDWLWAPSAWWLVILVAVDGVMLIVVSISLMEAMRRIRRLRRLLAESERSRAQRESLL